MNPRFIMPSRSIMSIRLKLKLFGIALWFMLTGALQTLYGQTDGDSLRIDLDPIEVTAIHSAVSAEKAPLALSIYNRQTETLNHESALSLTGIGHELPGLWVNDRQNYALGEKMTIRGIGWRSAFGVRGIQVVLNDMPLTVADGQTMINIIDPAFIRRAELVRGPAASYWGNSSGGVLYLSTVPHLEERNQRFRLRTMAGSYGLRKGEAEFSLSKPGHNMSTYASYLSSEGFRDYSSVEMLRGGLTGSVSLSPKSHLKYQAAGIYMPKAQHPSSLTAGQAAENPTMAIPSFVASEAGKEISQGQTGLSYILETGAGILNVTGYGIYRDLSNPLPFAIITVNRWAGGLRATLDKNWDSFDLQIGAESKLQNDDRTEFDNVDGSRGPIQVNQIEKVWNQALFTTGSITLDRFTLLGGLRYDRLTFTTDAPDPQQSGKRAFDAISPSIGINYQPGNSMIFANFSTSFEAPTTTELVNRPGGGNGFNPDLQPEKTVGLELGARGTVNSLPLSYDIAAYQLWIYDLLFPYQLTSNGPTYYRNQGETNHMGIEGHLSWQMNRDWRLSTTANATRAEFKNAQTLDSLSLAGHMVPGIPEYRVNTQLKWSPDMFIASVSYEFVSQYPVNNLNTSYNDEYHIIDLKFSYRKSIPDSGVQLQPFINVNNLFDARYNGSVMINSSGGQYYEPAPGRNWQAGIALQF